ncbi:SIR2 family protein [Cupriavidus sp. SIMBA_020]|uniref:SIR2 family protein n=1 Tax=Cupriavidus sp. SIMBA_020 TaxID=3085766 RepID=UPI003979D3D1
MMQKAIDRVARFFSESKHPILFAGAGVSAKAGIPVWGSLLKAMAEWLRKTDPLLANKAIELIAKGDFLRAADVIFISDGATEAEKLKFLKENLQSNNADAIKMLCKLPFKGAITTNFDRLLNDAFARSLSLAPLDFKRGDISFRQALWATEFYVARIHGAVEEPTSIVLTQRQFDELRRDTVYQNFLSQMSTRTNLFFVGFSFADPAIENVLQEINSVYGPLTQGEHIALVPEDLPAAVEQKLNRLNIERVSYPHIDSDKNHDKLWEILSAVEKMLAAPTIGPTAPTRAISKPFNTAKRYLASCYARLSLGAQLTPLRDSVIEGMVSALIQRSAPKAIPVSSIVDSLHKDMALHRREAEDIVKRCLTSLADEKLCLWHKRAEPQMVSWLGDARDEGTLQKAIETLISSAIDRAFVQEQLRETEAIRDGLREFFTSLVLQRGWDLGVAFANGIVPDSTDVKALMFRSCPGLSTMEITTLTRVCEVLINNPTPKEATILTALGRASFALELAIQTPRSQLFHGDVLPSRVYLDANVVMPTFAIGHPFQPVYQSVLSKLSGAARAAGGTTICTTSGYVNEIVSHKRLALEQYAADPENFSEDAKREALYFGSGNVNVFVGAYANLSANDPDLTFPKYIEKYAPYETEADLAQWLGKQGVLVVKGFQLPQDKVSAMTLDLQRGYNRNRETLKLTTLIEHDAIQLAALARDLDEGKRSVFVTADKGLREIVGTIRGSTVAEHMISHIGLTQLVDLLVGDGAESRSLAHLMWDARVSEKANDVRQYFTALCLQSYDEAMAMELPSLVEEFSDRVIREAKRTGINVEAGGDDRKLFTIAGTFEDDFFNAMRNQIEKRNKQAP